MSTQSNCSICLESTSPLDFILLLCNHEFCKNCLIKDWTLKIKAGQISENFLNCLSNNCKVPINYYILKENLSCEIFEKYDAYCLEQYVTESKNEKSIHCPKCSKLSIIHKDSQYFNCPVCISKFCANEKCLGYWKDHEKLTCEEFQSKKNTFGQKEFDRLLLENNWKRCPKCNTPIEKIKTCNYIVCSSKLCQKKTIFCYICGELLNENQIKSHYTESNYYKLCEEKRDIQMKFEKTKENLQCPLCGVWSKENFGTITVDNKYKIYKCMSDKCKNNKFCLNCKLKVESNNDKEIKRHLNMLCVEKLRISNLKPNCPECGNKDPELCDLPENFNNSILICKSKKCEKAIYCLICLKKVSEELIGEHLSCKLNYKKYEFSNLENYKNKNENIPYLEQQNQKHLEQQFQSSKFENHKEINHFAKQKVDEGEISKRKNLNIAQFNNQINEKKNVIYPQSEKQLKKPVEKGFIARNQIIFVFGVVVIFIIIAFYFTI